MVRPKKIVEETTQNIVESVEISTDPLILRVMDRETKKVIKID